MIAGYGRHDLCRRAIAPVARGAASGHGLDRGDAAVRRDDASSSRSRSGGSGRFRTTARARPVTRFRPGTPRSTFAAATVLQQHLGWKWAVPTYSIASMWRCRGSSTIATGRATSSRARRRGSSSGVRSRGTAAISMRRRCCCRRARHHGQRDAVTELFVDRASRRVLRLGFPDAGWSSPVARWAHNPKVAGSNPAPATILSEGLRPSDSPTRSLARRCAGSLRSRGSLRCARSRRHRDFAARDPFHTHSLAASDGSLRFVGLPRRSGSSREGGWLASLRSLASSPHRRQPRTCPTPYTVARRSVRAEPGARTVSADARATLPRC